ncbi:MAG: transporter [Planctomycetes bacterium]|nr:transporter [Planctomycetota bacterium]
MSCRSLTRWQRANRAPDRSAARRKARSIVALVLALVSAAADAARALGQGRPPQAALGDPRTDEDRPLVGDRPDFTESTETIPRGRLQVEGGYTFVHDRAHRRRVHRQSAPELLGRLGLTERWELRLGWSGYDWENVLSRIRRDDGRWESMTTIAQGANDMSIGAKVKLCDQADLRPHLGLIGQISVPSGSIGLRTGDVDLEVKLLWAYDLTDRFSLAGRRRRFRSPWSWRRAGERTWSTSATTPTRRTAARPITSTAASPSWSPTICNWTPAPARD